MSTKFKTIICMVGFVLVSKIMLAQTLEVRLGYSGGNTPIGTGPIPTLGPITTFSNTTDSIALGLDDGSPNNDFSNPPTAPINQTTKVFLRFTNQQYTGLHYSNASTGLLFGASATTSYNGGTPEPVGTQQPQQVAAFNLFNDIGTYTSPGSNTGIAGGYPGGPASSNFSAKTSSPGAGIIAGWPGSPGNDGNGAFSVFTVAQVQYDGGASNFPVAFPAIYPQNTAYSSSQRYYYGDLVVSFNRFIENPVIHFAGLGGAYRYFIGGDPANPANWRSTFFSTELDLAGFTMTKLSGNPFFQVASPSQITNSATYPSGGSTSDPANFVNPPIYPFDDLGAASGSVRVNATVRTITFRVYLRGAPSKPSMGGSDPAGADFAWSTSRLNTSLYNREPVTGDLWWVSVSAEPPQLIPLPSTGLNLTASLNGNNVNLNWKTQTELNSKEFAIERSTDGVNFSQIGTKQAAGSSTTETNYTLVDPNMNVPVYYYRVKLTDLDGRYGYSNIATVKKSNIKGVRAFPNPAVTQLSLEFSNLKGAYSISVYNSTGQEVAKQTANISSTVQYVTVNRNSLPTGTYSVRITNADNTEVYTEKVLFQ